MGNIVPFVDILIFAIIAIFLVVRLRNMLGTRDGYEQSPEETGQNRPHPVEEAEQAKIVPLHPESLSGSGLKAIQKADPSFSEDGFLQGASAAFSMILQAFAEGDLSQLRRLLAMICLMNFPKLSENVTLMAKHYLSIFRRLMM